jgi:hypothetical protein
MSFMRPVLIALLGHGFNLAFALAREIREVKAPMSVFQYLPLGRPIPDRLHAVSCSLPTMRDLIGYEEKPAVVG